MDSPSSPRAALPVDHRARRAEPDPDGHHQHQGQQQHQQHGRQNQIAAALGESVEADIGAVLQAHDRQAADGFEPPADDMRRVQLRHVVHRCGRVLQPLQQAHHARLGRQRQGHEDILHAMPIDELRHQGRHAAVAHIRRQTQAVGCTIVEQAQHLPARVDLRRQHARHPQAHRPAAHHDGPALQPGPTGQQGRQARQAARANPLHERRQHHPGQHHPGVELVIVLRHQAAHAQHRDHAQPARHDAERHAGIGAAQAMDPRELHRQHQQQHGDRLAFDRLIKQRVQQQPGSGGQQGIQQHGHRRQRRRGRCRHLVGGLPLEHGALALSPSLRIQTGVPVLPCVPATALPAAWARAAAEPVARSISGSRLTCDSASTAGSERVTLRRSARQPLQEREQHLRQVSRPQAGLGRQQQVLRQVEVPEQTLELVLVRERGHGHAHAQGGDGQVHAAGHHTVRPGRPRP